MSGLPLSAAITALLHYLPKCLRLKAVLPQDSRKKSLDSQKNSLGL